MATYTSLDIIDLSAIAQHYDLADPIATPLKGGAANSSFLLETVRGRHVLTALDNQDEAGARELARFNRAFADRGVPTTHVVANTDGDDITLLDGHRFLLKEFVPGDVVDPLPAEQLPEAGRILARLHLLPAEGLGLPTATRRLSPQQRGLIADFPDRSFADWLTAQLEAIAQHEADQQRSEVPIHGDLFSDNLIVGPNAKLTVIDWETTSLDDPLLDLGMAAVGVCQDQSGPFAADRLHQLLEGYSRLRPLNDEDYAALPSEIVHAAVIIAYHRYYRHNVRFPNPDRATYHRAMIEFAASVPERL